jgi:hypothetical protein
MIEIFLNDLIGLLIINLLFFYLYLVLIFYSIISLNLNSIFPDLQNFLN